MLFVLIGLAVLSLRPTGGALLAGCLAVPVVLAARWLSIGALLTVHLARTRPPVSRCTASSC